MNYEIRPVEFGDLDQLVNLCAEHATYEGCDYSKRGKKEVLQKLLLSKHSTLKCLVVASGNALIGYATFVKQISTWDATNYVYMDCLYLKDDYRGFGLGKELLVSIKTYAYNNGCCEIQWQTPIDNNRAIKFYKRQGAEMKTKSRFFLNVDFP